MSGLVRLARAMRDAYKLEVLEPRVLLSADPVLGAAHAVVMQPVDPYATSVDGAYDPADALAQHPGQVPHASLPDGWQQWAPPPADASPSGNQTFAVDARAFDVGYSQTASGFMAGTVMLDQAANDPAEFNVSSSGPTMHALALVGPGGSQAVTTTPATDLTLASGDVFEIEIDGTGSDRLDVSGAVSLNGTLKVSLINGATPADGQIYTFLSYGTTLTGSFAEGEGLVSVGNGLFFEIQHDTTAHELKLVAHRLDAPSAFAVNLLYGAAGAQGQALADQAGEWFNASYFARNVGFTIANASLDLGQGVKLSGSLAASYTQGLSFSDGSGTHTYDVWKIGLANGGGYLGLDANDASKPGLTFGTIDAAVVILDGQGANAAGWLLAEGTAGNIALQGVNHLTLAASSLSLEFSLGLGQLNGQANHAGINLSAQAQSLLVDGTTFTFDGDGALGDFASMSGSGVFSYDPVTLSGTFGLAVSAGSLTAVGEHIEAGVRVKAPTGAEVALAWRSNQRRSNVIASASFATGDSEATGALVLSLRQPLLRGAGRDVVETDLRVARYERDIGGWQFRQQVLRIGSEALSAYWQLWRARSTQALRRAALDNAQETAEDVKSRVDGGRLPPAALDEATAVLSARRAELARGQQALFDAEAKVRVLLDLPPEDAGWTLADPELEPPAPARELAALAERLPDIEAAWPPLRMALLKREQADARMRLAYSKKLPALDVQASYSSNSLTYGPMDAAIKATQGRNPDWTIGVAMEVPLGGDRRAQAEYRAQQLRVEQSALEVHSVRQALASDYFNRAAQFGELGRELAQLREELTAREQLEAGVRDQFALGATPRNRLLRLQADVLDARLRYIDGASRWALARVALQLVDGSLLAAHDVQLTE